MERRTSFHLFTIAGVLTLMTLLAMAPLHAQPRTNARECRFQGMQRGTWTEREVKATIRCAAERWPVDLATAFYIADRESNFEHDAVNGSSGACGVWQFYPSSSVRPRLAQLDRATGPRFDVRHRGCFNARGVTLWTIWYAHRFGWGPWGF